jgi:TRAP-type mannitol/chloroaromatic compound transport system substrate-binding protein
MQRRTVLKLGAGAAAGALMSAPAIAQSAPQIRWRMTSSFTKTLDITFGAGELFCRMCRS